MSSSPLRFDHPGFTLTGHLFRQFLVEEEMTTKDAEEVAIRTFYEWAMVRIESNPECELPLFPDKEELIELYDFNDEIFELVSALFENPFSACGQLYEWWPMFCFAGRRPLKHKIEAISLSAAIRFEDGHMAHIPMPTGAQAEPYTDGMIMTLWRGQLNRISQLLVVDGADSLHPDETLSQSVPTHNPKRPGGLGL
jgi:hypothetical protein